MDKELIKDKIDIIRHRIISKNVLKWGTYLPEEQRHICTYYFKLKGCPLNFSLSITGANIKNGLALTIQDDSGNKQTYTPHDLGSSTQLEALHFELMQLCGKPTVQEESFSKEPEKEIISQHVLSVILLAPFILTVLGLIIYMIIMYI